MGTACCPCVRPICGVSASSLARRTSSISRSQEHGEDHGADGVPVAKRRCRIEDVHGGRAEVHKGTDGLRKMAFQDVHQGAHVMLGLCLLRVHLLGADFRGSDVEPLLQSGRDFPRRQVPEESFQKRDLHAGAVPD